MIQIRNWVGRHLHPSHHASYTSRPSLTSVGASKSGALEETVAGALVFLSEVEAGGESGALEIVQGALEGVLLALEAVGGQSGALEIVAGAREDVVSRFYTGVMIVAEAVAN